jgi:hypothetical protein
MSHAKWEAGDQRLRRRDHHRCGASTRAGGICRVRAEPSKARCRFHGGLSTGPRIDEGRTRIAEASVARLWGQPVHRINWGLSARGRTTSS